MDGFDQDKGTDKRDKQREILRCLFTPERETLEPLCIGNSKRTVANTSSMIAHSSSVTHVSMAGPSKGRPLMNHAKTDSGIPTYTLPGSVHTA